MKDFRIVFVFSDFLNGTTLAAITEILKHERTTGGQSSVDGRCRK